MQVPTTTSPSRFISKKCWRACRRCCAAAVAGPRPIWSAVPIVLDTRAQTVTVEGRPVELTTFEYRILEHLMLKAGEVISKTDLTEQLYEQDFERDSNVIEVFIGRLRRKLDPDERHQAHRDPARPRLSLRAGAQRGLTARIGMHSISRRLLVLLTLLLLLFFGVMIAVLDARFRTLAESIRCATLLDAQMVALIASAEPDATGHIVPRLPEAESRLDRTGFGPVRRRQRRAARSFWRSPRPTGSVHGFRPAAASRRARPSAT